MDELVDRDGLCLRRDHPEVPKATLTRRIKRAGLVPVLPGAFVDRDRQYDAWPWLTAVGRVYPGAVLLGRAALTVQRLVVDGVSPGRRFTPIAVADRRKHTHKNTPAFAFTRRGVPPEHLIRHGSLVWTAPVYTAVDLMAVDAGAEACDVLRRAGADGCRPMLTALRDVLVLFEHEADYWKRRAVFSELRDCPWSILELRLHRLLRAAGLHGWHGNWRVDLGTGTAVVDVAFPDFRVAIEADGRRHHEDADAFRRDRVRWNRLGGEGWVMLRATWDMVVGHPEEFLTQVVGALTRQGWSGS